MKRRIAGGTVTIAAVFFLAVFFDASPVDPVAAAPRSCESLAALELPQATITSARSISAGAFTPPGSAQPGGAAPDTQVYAKLPAFCRVEATLKPSSDSDIRIEVWLPASGWNGKFQAVGNGGWAATTDIDLAIKVDNGITGLADPNLRPFFRRGGKLLMYHGWADPQVPAMNSVTYFNKGSEGRRPANPSSFTWCPAWRIAAEERAPTPSTRWRRSSSGWPPANRPSRLPLRAS